jgi:hypothetical protein
VPFRPWVSCGGSCRDPHLWGFCGAAQAPAADLGPPVGAGLATQQADPGRPEHHAPRDGGHGTAFIVRDAFVRVGFRMAVDGSAEGSFFRTCPGRAVCEPRPVPVEGDNAPQPLMLRLLPGLVTSGFGRACPCVCISKAPSLRRLPCHTARQARVVAV